MKVVVISGGMSLERDISIAAGDACTIALKSLGHDVQNIDAAHNLAQKLSNNAPDVVFNALHGRWGEDGCVQGLLEWMRIPYTHSGVLSSALSMDKQKSKDAYARGGVLAPLSVLKHRDEIMSRHIMPAPYIVKPHNEGSSLGGFYLVEKGDPVPHITEEDRTMFMVEQFIPGRELTVTVLGDKAIAVSEFDIGKWYDFRSKYALSDANRILPAKLPQEIYDHCLDLAEKAHKALGCRGISRTDFRWNEDLGMEGLFALETNTQPGMRPNSNAGEQAAFIGLSFPELCEFLLNDASLDR